MKIVNHRLNIDYHREHIDIITDLIAKDLRVCATSIFKLIARSIVDYSSMNRNLFPVQSVSVPSFQFKTALKRFNFVTL